LWGRDRFMRALGMDQTAFCADDLQNDEDAGCADTDRPGHARGDIDSRAMISRRDTEQEERQSAENAVAHRKAVDWIPKPQRSRDVGTDEEKCDSSQDDSRRPAPQDPANPWQQQVATDQGRESPSRCVPALAASPISLDQ
jgi:hypothetical protein